MSARDQTALVVRVPEAESLVGPFRQDHDPVAARGMPAHVTILYPFRAPEAIDVEVQSALQQLFASHAPFHCAFTRTDTFPGVLYLVPDPDEPFRALTRELADLFPDTPPYGGAIADPHPHLTVAHADDPESLAPIATRFAGAAQNLLPIRTRVTHVWLMESRNGMWRPRESFALGPTPDIQ